MALLNRYQSMLSNGFRSRMTLLQPCALRTPFLLLVLAALGGCATAPGRTSSSDPWEGFNRGVYRFNDFADRNALKPVAKGYKAVTPGWARTGVSNFFSNLTYPWTIVNQLLQGKPVMACRDTGRLVINSVVGIGGLIDVATHAGLPENNEDFGQTLAVWGVPSGPFLTIPFFGPSSLRDGPSRIADYFSGVTLYIDVSWELEWSARGLAIVNDRAALLQLDSQLNNVFDPYAFLRDVWVQRREYQIYDGNPPEPTFDDEPLEEEPAPETAPTPVP